MQLASVMRPNALVRKAAIIAINVIVSSCTTSPSPSLNSPIPLSAESRRPIIIAHRGASGYRPEHTLAAYALAIEMDADFIEPDLVSTRDGVLVCRHENEIGGTTDVASRFPDRQTTKVIDGDSITGWFTEDLTLAELRTVRARERLPMRSKAHDGEELVPTFEEVLALADSAGKRRGRAVGVYPETKHPSYFRSIGLPLEPLLLTALIEHHLDTKASPVFIQSFDAGNLRELAKGTSVRLIQLLDTNTARDLSDIASYAAGIGINTRAVVGRLTTDAPTTLVADAHREGLLVHVWTLRPEPEFLAPRYHGDPLAEVRELEALGVDGMFGDYPDQLKAGLKR